MRDALLTAAGALLVAVLNELRARARARQADIDRAAALRDAARAAAQETTDRLDRPARGA